ncbi:MAG: ATP-binding protein [Clostridia bacterium]|nr:ATP-binding protein [Clostridia bacterium]
MKLIRLSYAYAVLNNFICIVLSAFLMSRLWRLTGVWLSFAVGEILSLLIIILWNVSHNRGNALFDKMLCIDDRFRGNILSSRGWSCASLNEAVSVSEAIRSYCNSEGAPSRTAFALSLAAEELCTNILHYGFADGKPHSIDLMVTRLTDGWMMRIRDDCQLFNPVQYVQLFDESDPSAHIGIRLTRGLIRKIDYISALKLNNLLLEIDS